MHGKVDTILGHVLQISERTLALSDLPHQLQTEFNRMADQMSATRKFLHEVSTKDTPGTFIIRPELTPRQTMLLASGKGEASSHPSAHLGGRLAKPRHILSAIHGSGYSRRARRGRPLSATGCRTSAP